MLRFDENSKGPGIRQISEYVCETAKKKEHTFEDITSIFAQTAVLRKREDKGGVEYIIGETALSVF